MEFLPNEALVEVDIKGNICNPSYNDFIKPFSARNKINGILDGHIMAIKLYFTSLLKKPKEYL